MTPSPLRSSALPFAHGFFTRQGGVSTGPYATLNCSLSSGDARAIAHAHLSSSRAWAAFDTHAQARGGPG